MPPTKLKPRIVVDKSKPLRALGVTCGIGSMLVGARQAGFDVVGNIEWRRYYHLRDAEDRNTFLTNFSGAYFVEGITDLDDDSREESTECDLALGHPECGNFSLLGGSLKNRAELMKDPCDIPLFVDLISELRPRFFVMDDLPKSFGAFPMSEYAERLKDYDLYPEWISNWGYGNIQKFRNRMFMIGARKEEGWAFVPGEVDHSLTTKDIIGDLPAPSKRSKIANHDPHDLEAICARFTNVPRRGDRHKWGDMIKVLGGFPEGRNISYINSEGVEKVRFGSCKVRWDGPSAVLHGGNPILHPRTCLPLTIRERARIQGFPDDFVFYGTRLDKEGRWNHEREGKMVKQTGKAMPVQFCRYVSEQIYAHIMRKTFKSSGVRIIKPNPLVDSAKKWYCSTIGYANQVKACNLCWMSASCTIRTQKYGIGEEGVKTAPRQITYPRERKTIPLPMVPSSLPKKKSALVGRKLGVGRRMAELINEGIPDQEIAETIRKEFPGSSANLTDVSKIRSKKTGGT